MPKHTFSVLFNILPQPGPSFATNKQKIRIVYVRTKQGSDKMLAKMKTGKQANRTNIVLNVFLYALNAESCLMIVQTSVDADVRFCIFKTFLFRSKRTLASMASA